MSSLSQSHNYDIHSYDARFRQAVLSLMFYSQRIHSHLDWYKAVQWLSLDENLVECATLDDELVGVLGLSAPLKGAAWVRLALVHNEHDPAEIFAALWERLQARLQAMETESVSILVVSKWISHYLPNLGFRYLDDVITLLRPPMPKPEIPDHSLHLRAAYLDDIPEIMALDHAAFRPPWQMSALDLRYAQRLSASCTLAEWGGRPVGYELSTRHQSSGHLARLAVHPDVQGQRVGAVLLNQMLGRFAERGVRTVTVNTQRANVRSQRLYTRNGFERNGFDLPVWQSPI